MPSPLSVVVVLIFNAAVEYRSFTELGTGPPLPPTFEIEISKKDPLLPSLPPVTSCDGSAEADSNINGCVGYRGSLVNSTRNNGSVLLMSNRTEAVLSLPVAVDPDITS